VATIFDLIEVTNISAHTTYSQANGNLLGVVESAVSSEFDDGEFDGGDLFTLEGQTYRIDQIQEPDSSGQFTTADGTDISFNPQSESDLDVIFLTVSNGVETRHFIIPKDSYGPLDLEEIRTGEIKDVAGNDAALVSTQDNDVKVVCFCAGTMIRRADGSDIAVENLKVGECVETLDNGAQAVRWVGQKSLSLPALLRHPNLRPIRIPSGSLGPGLPKADLFVSPQHRILVRSRIARRMFGVEDVLVAAKKLVGVNGIAIANPAWQTTYLHVLLDHHNILVANGAPCESLFLGPQARQSLGSKAIEEISLIFNGVPGVSPPRDTAHLLPGGRRVRRLAKRHQQNGKWLFQM